MIYFLQEKNYQLFNVLKNQENNINKKYIKSPYLIEVFHNGFKIIYNILINEKIAISFPYIKEDYNYLVEKWYYIEKNINPYDLYKKIQNKLNKSILNQNNYNLLENFSHVIIFTTLGCNANCYYCYEKDIKDNKNKLTEEKIDKLITLIKQNNKKEITIGWFGGEPLYNESIMDYACNKLLKENISYKTSIITNGILFNKENIKKAVTLWNLQQSQITIDGTELIYEKIKQVPPGTFNKLLENIDLLLKNKISVSIRLNVSNYNVKDLKKVVYILFSKFKKYTNFTINAHELFGEEQENRTYQNLWEVQSIIEDTFGTLTVPTIEWKNSCCMSDQGHAIALLPDGNITICEHLIDKNIVTNLNKDFYNIDVINNFSQYSDREECQLCTFRPGCIYSNACPAFAGQRCCENRKKYILMTQKKKLYKLANKKRKRRKHLMITREMYKNLDIYNKATALIDAFNTQDGSNLNYPVKVNFYLQKNMNVIIDLAKEIEQKRIEIIQKFGTKQENSEEYFIPEDKITEATQELQDFFDLEQEVPINMMKLDWFDKIDMNAAQVAAISFMIEEEE